MTNCNHLMLSIDNKRAGKTLPSEEPSADEQKPTCHEVARQIGELNLGLARILSIK